MTLEQTEKRLNVIEQRIDFVVAQDLTAAGSINRMQRLIQTLSEYPINHLLWQTIIRVATIGETYFFRDIHQLNARRLSVLPALIEERRRKGLRQLRLWSAGCSTGAEPYTLAIMLRELLADLSAWGITISRISCCLLNARSVFRVKRD